MKIYSAIRNQYLPFIKMGDNDVLKAAMFIHSSTKYSVMLVDGQTIQIYNRTNLPSYRRITYLLQQYITKLLSILTYRITPDIYIER